MSPIEEYADIKREIKRLQKRLLELQPEVMLLIPNKGLKTDGATFKWVSYTKWLYSRDLIEAERGIKTEKRLQRETGRAKKLSERLGLRVSLDNK